MHCWGRQQGCSLPAPKDSSRGAAQRQQCDRTKIKLGINCLKHRLEFGQSWEDPGIAFWKKIAICLCREGSPLPWQCFLPGCSWATVGYPRGEVTSGPTKERGFKQLLRYSKNGAIEKELLQKSLLECFRSISTHEITLTITALSVSSLPATFPLQYQTLSNQMLWFYFDLPWIFILVITLFHLYNLFIANTSYFSL